MYKLYNSKQFLELPEECSVKIFFLFKEHYVIICKLVDSILSWYLLSKHIPNNK